MCVEDEPLDTTCCSVGADISQLPSEAKLRAEKENRRFLDLSDSERAIEIASLVKAKKVCLYLFLSVCCMVHCVTENRQSSRCASPLMSLHVSSCRL